MCSHYDDSLFSSHDTDKPVCIGKMTILHKTHCQPVFGLSFCSLLMLLIDI